MGDLLFLDVPGHIDVPGRSLSVKRNAEIIHANELVTKTFAGMTDANEFVAETFAKMTYLIAGMTASMMNGE